MMGDDGNDATCDDVYFLCFFVKQSLRKAMQCMEPKICDFLAPKLLRLVHLHLYLQNATAGFIHTCAASQCI